MIKASGMWRGRPFIYLGLPHGLLSELVEPGTQIVFDTALDPPQGVGLRSGFVIVIEAGTDDDALKQSFRRAGFQLPGELK